LGCKNGKGAATFTITLNELKAVLQDEASRLLTMNSATFTVALNELKAAASAAKMFAFSAGKRNCVGCVLLSGVRVRVRRRVRSLSLSCALSSGFADMRADQFRFAPHVTW
jgi:ribosomal protein S26